MLEPLLPCHLLRDQQHQVLVETTRTRTLGPSPPPPQPSLQSNALFFPEEDDDRRWDPIDEDEEMLVWDASCENVKFMLFSGLGL